MEVRFRSAAFAVWSLRKEFVTVPIRFNSLPLFDWLNVTDRVADLVKVNRHVAATIIDMAHAFTQTQHHLHIICAFVAHFNVIVEQFFSPQTVEHNAYKQLKHSQYPKYIAAEKGKCREAARSCCNCSECNDIIYELIDSTKSFRHPPKPFGIVQIAIIIPRFSFAHTQCHTFQSGLASTPIAFQ